MLENVSQYLERLKEIRTDISLINSEIKETREEYEKTMSVLGNKLSVKEREMIELQENMVISIRFGDLIQEISMLSGIEINNIRVKLETNVAFDGLHNFNTMLNMLVESKKSYYIRMSLSSFNGNDCVKSFDYFTFLPFSLNEIQADGKMLVSHCSEVVKRSDGHEYTEIIINEGIENIILNFDLRYFEIDKDNVSWYPSEMFTQAIVNCVQKNNVKARRRTL